MLLASDAEVGKAVGGYATNRKLQECCNHRFRVIPYRVQ